MPSRRTSMLPKRFAAPWDLRFKFYLAAENTGARTAPQLTGNRGCESRGSALTRHGNELRKMKAKISRANTRLPRTPAGIHSAWGVNMDRCERWVCGHPQSLHRIYACTGSRFNPDPKKTERLWCQCQYSKRRKLLTPP